MNKFSYLRTTVIADDTSINEIKSRICKAKAPFYNMKKYQPVKEYHSFKMRKGQQYCIEALLLYDCETTKRKTEEGSRTAQKLKT